MEHIRSSRRNLVALFNLEILSAIVCGKRANRKIKFKTITLSAYYVRLIGSIHAK